MMFTVSPARLARMGHYLLLAATVITLGALPATAEEVLSVTVNKVEVINLERDATVVLIANPVIADVAVESERLIFLFGLEPGETNLLILDAEGEKILSMPVVVVPNLDRQVTINRASVNEEATFTCAPRCAAIATPAGTGSKAQGTGSAAGDSEDVREAAAGETTASKLNDVVEAVDDSADAAADRAEATSEALGLPIDDDEDSDTSD